MYSPLKNDLSIGAQFAKIKSTGACNFVYKLGQWDGKCIFEWTTKTCMKSVEYCEIAPEFLTNHLFGDALQQALETSTPVLNENI